MLKLVLYSCNEKKNKFDIIFTMSEVEINIQILVAQKVKLEKFEYTEKTYGAMKQIKCTVTG